MGSKHFWTMVAIAAGVVILLPKLMPTLRQLPVVGSILGSL